jgi:hypothetical protein
MSRYWGQPGGIHFLNTSLSFMPPSELQDHAQLRMPPNTVFDNGIQPMQLRVPQALATMTQLSPYLSQQGQKRTVSDVEYASNTASVQQHRDPTFYGLSTSLPMSTYTTQTSLPPPQTSNKRLRQGAQNVQGGHMPMQHPPQTSAYYANRPVASARPRAVYSSPGTHSRRGYGSNEPYRARHPHQQPTSNSFLRSTTSTNPYMSDCPPSWNWINQIDTPGTVVNMLGQQDDNFTFTWPVLNDESQAVNYVHNMHQGSRQMQHPSMQSNLSDLAANTAIPYSTHEQSRAHHTFKVTPGTMIKSFGHTSAPVEGNRAVDGPFGSQVTLKPCAGHGKQPPRPEQIQWNYMHTGCTSLTGHSLPDVPHVSAFDACPFENSTNFDHDFGFDFGLGEGLGEGDTSSNIKEPAQDPDKETLTQSVNKCIPTESSDEALLELLQPVVSYLASCSYSPTQNVADDLASHAMSVPDGVDVCRTPGETSLTGDTTAPPATMDSESKGGQCLANAEAYSNFVDERGPTNSHDQGSMQSRSGTSDGNPITMSPIGRRTSIIIQPNVVSTPRVLSSPRDLDQCSLRAAFTTADTIPNNPSAVNSSMSERVQTSVGLKSSVQSSSDDCDVVGSSQRTTPYSLRQARSITDLAENCSDLRHDMQEWLDGSSADVGQPVSVKIKVLPTPAGEGIYGWEVVWVNGSSRVDAGQPKPMMSSEEEMLRAIRRRILILRSSLPPWRFISNSGTDIE